MNPTRCIETLAWAVFVMLLVPRLQALTMPRLGFGVVMRDFNCDGQQDIFTANGHMDHNNADGGWL